MSDSPIRFEDLIWHNSAMNDLLQCEQKFVYKYVDRLKTPSTRLKLPLMRGSWFHGLMAAQGLKQGRAQGTLLDDPMTINLGHDALSDVPTMDLTPDRAHALWIESVWNHIPTTDDDEGWATLPEDVWFLYQRYIAAHRHTLVNEKVLAVEQQWQRNYEAFTFGGRIDRIVEVDGLVVVRDHKTTANPPGVDERLLQTQLNIYAWGVAPWLAAQGAGEPRLTEYDYVVTTPVPAVKFTNPTKANMGRLYANQGLMDKYALDTLLAPSLNEWATSEKIAALLEKHGYTEDDVASLMDSDELDKFRVRCAEEGTPHFFNRSSMPINEQTVRTLLEQSVAVAQTGSLLGTTGSGTRNVTKNCSWCDMQAICVGDLLGDDTSLLRREFVARDLDFITEEGE